MVRIFYKILSNIKANLRSHHLRTLLLTLAITIASVTHVWGQTNYSGTYYIGSRDYNANNTTTNYYLCPTEGWCYYQATNDFSGTDTGMPFLTTHQCRDGVYDVNNKAVWNVEKHPTEDYYYIKRASDGKYVVLNGQIRTTGDANRMRVHLEALANPDDKALFALIPNGTAFNIKPKTLETYLTVNGGNDNSLQGVSGKTGGPTGYTNTKGIIGIYPTLDGNSNFYLESAISIGSPTITNNNDGTFTITAATGATIYYTTDGTTPTTSTTTTGTTSVTVNQTASMTVIKAIAKAASDVFPTAVTTYSIPICETPVITITGNNVVITCATEGAVIHYTTDGSAATSSSATYTAPFAQGSASTFRAIATKAGYIASSEAILLPPTEVSSSSEITNMNGYYILKSDFSSTASIGTSGNPFRGTIDGRMNILSGLSHPLVAYANGALIKNVILEEVSINESGNTGAIASNAAGTTRIYNCGILEGTVRGTGYTGGLVGLLDGTSRVVNCYSYADITGGTDVGGIVGYNNATTTAGSINTMVMNCMFYGDITGGTTVSPVYGGKNIANLTHNSDRTQDGLNTFNYYAYERLKTKDINTYNSALAVEDKYLTRFEYYRLLLNSNKKLAAFYATGFADNANEMAKWVLETADRTINDPKPYPILKAQGYYPSIINPDFDNAPDSATAGRNHGGKLGKTLSVTISGVGSNAPTGASITRSSLTLQRTDKDFDRFNYNYDKVQLPYYSEVGEGNYTGNRVVTGWKITSVTGGTAGTYKAGDEWGGYNFADRNCTNKDLYSVSGRVFSQGAYFDVPYGVTSITIEPYWGNAIYVADQYYDVVYKNDYSGKQGVSQTGTQAGGSIKFNNQTVKTSITGLGSGTTVYDNAVVLVGNFHLDNVPSTGTTPFTMMSVDEDNDHEPDYSLIYHHKNRTAIAPIRFDFLNIPGTAQAQKPNGASLICNFTIFKTKGWFEVTNTASFYTSQLEYENLTSVTKVDAPLILLGGVIDQFVSTQSSTVTGKTIYIHVGSNVWIKEFGMGTHSDGQQSTPHVPVSVTGGEFPGFYLTGTYKADAIVRTDNAECYISGGYIHEAAGASLEQIDGDVRWQIYNADIDNFFGGGINDAKPIKGDITVDIYNSHVTLFCGGPKFGNMQTDKKVTTNAEGCTFGKFFGAGYGGTSYSKKKYYDLDSYNWATLQGYYTTDRGKYFNGISTAAAQQSGKDYGKKGPGVATDFDYEFFVWTSGATGARFYVNFAAFSLAQCNDVESNLKKCTIEENYYGGGSLGKVVGTATSVLEDCTVNGNVYGAGYSASLPTVEVRDGGFTENPNFNSQSGMFEPGVFSGTTTFTWQNATEAGKTLSNGNSGSDLSNHVLYTDADLTTLGQVAHTDLTIKGTTTVAGSVYGGGEESSVGGATEVNIESGTIGTDVFGGGKEGNVGGSVTVNINGGTVTGSLYGGGALANTNINNVTAGYGTNTETIPSTSTNTTTVNLLGGTIHGDAYGGGLGQLGNEPVAALVYGDVNVNLGSSGGSTATAFITSYYSDAHSNVVKSGRVFGCNNLNGSPKGDVTVTIYKTVAGNVTRTAIEKLKLKETDDGYVAPTYELTAVYGGGNLADFTTPISDKKANVIIETCDVSIRDVYGGGNAAAVPETNVLVRGAYEIQEVFGGGNGMDQYTTNGGTTWVDNPGANVNGNANTLLTGGYIHEAYGGSNDKGIISGTVIIDVATGDGDPSHCALDVERIVGAGKNADIEGDLIMVLGCKPDTKIPELFGGADNANVHGNVELTITSGKFGKVFGGNNQGGAILGHIHLNIEETGDCEVPIEIDELYLGGNEAAYSVFGYYDSGETLSNGKPKYLPRTAEMHAITDTSDPNYKEPITNPAADATHTFPYSQPMLNIISCTYIGKVFGGGLGTGAAMYANPTVNINMVQGTFANNATKGVPAKMTELGLNSSDNPNNLGVLVDVYGGGNEAAVNGNTTVNIGTEIGNPITMESSTATPDVLGAYISGTVYGAGKGVVTNPAAAIVTGNTLVNMAGGKICRSIYGGGELGSVGTFTEYYTTAQTHPYHAVGEPKTCKAGTGLTKVMITGGQVGLVNQKMPDPANPTSDDDYGYVFCASKGIADSVTYNNANLLAVSGSSHLEISGGLVAASVYGGSENGQVLGDTYVKVTGGQIGSGYYKNNGVDTWDDVYTDAQWTTAIEKIKNGTFTDADAASFHECDAWPFGTEGNRHVYDYFADTAGYDAQDGAKPGSDGHSYYGHVFGGGSGYYPFAPGKWRRTAGRVNGNTLVEITGGHILTNVYGGNEITDVVGHSKVVMKAGTVGVPRTLAGIQARPVNSYIFGAGMGDPRVLFNGWSNVASSEVIVDSVAVVFGSVFGGGEDGHILGDVTTTIKGNALIGTFGTSGVDGNIFGSGRGFSALALTAGAVCGNVTVNIQENAKILGSIFGGGRLAAVGTHLAAEGTDNYGVLIPDGKQQVLGGSDVDAPGTTHGHVTINITGGTIGTQAAMSNHQFSVGDVFGGSKGTLMDDWAKSQMLGLVKNTTVNISQAEGYTTTIYGNVYGGGEIASVGSYNYATAAQATTYNQTHPSEPMAEGDVYSLREDNTGLATILITGGTIGQNSLADTHGSVFGGCLGKAGTAYSGYSFVNNSDVTLNGGTVYGCVFGGGENGHVFSNTDVKIKGGTVGIPLHDKVIANLSEPEKDNMIYRGNVYGGGRGIDKTSGGDYSITAGKVAGNTNVTVEGGTIYRNVYGGGSLASVGVRDDAADTDGLATVTIKGGQIGTDGGAAANDYTTLIPNRESRKENGYVYGSGRGMAAGAVGNSTLVQLAYTKNTIVNIEGTANVTGSVFGGGENGHVKKDTKVYVKENCLVGTELTDDEHVIDDNGRGRLIYRGNVYGGGRGIDTGGDGNYSLTAGRVYGDTYVEVSGGKIYHDVFGGGSLASVGNETIDSTTGEVTYGDESGETEVHIKGGIIGYSSTAAKQGFNCGFVYGGCRGLSAAPNTDIVKMAYVHDAKVYIEPGADVKGSVFGGGANGHVKNDTYVEITGGSIGTPLLDDEVGFDDHGVAVKPVFRGNVYAGGRGVDMYQQSGSDRYSLTAGAVYGNAELKMTGGHVWHNIYGSGAMASVGTVKAKASGQHVHDEVVDANGNLVNNTDYNPNESDINYLTGVFVDTTGIVKVTITGGTVGDTTPGHEGRNNGRVYGAGRGVSADRSDYVASMEYVNKTFVTIGTSGQTSYTGSEPDELNYPYIYGAVFGGGENGHVKTDTDVKIYSGIIGWPLVEGASQEYKTAADGSTKNPYRGNVFGGGRGVDPVHHGVSSEQRSSSAGRVYGHTNVTMTGGVVRRSIYGGGLLASVGVYRLNKDDYMHITDMIEDEVDAGDATVTISGGYVGNVNPDGSALSGTDAGGTAYLAPGDNNGFVFGSSCGMVADEYVVGQDSVDIQYKQMGYTHSTHVNISGDDTHIFGCVFGSGENGHVWEDAIVNISGGQIGSENSTSIYTGNVYGSGRGVDHPHAQISETAGKVRGNTTVNITGGTVWRDVYGGGSLASVGEAKETAADSKKNVTDDPTTNNPFPYSTGLTRVVIDGTTTAVHGSVYGSGRGVASTDELYKQAAYVKNTLVTVKGSAHVFQNVFGGGNAGHVRKNTDVTVDGAAKIDGNVYGGGAGDISSPTAGLVNHDVAVNIKGGLIAKDVYGGGAIANTNVHDARNTAVTDCDESNRGNAKTEVNLTGGIILGDAYGGGQGVIAPDGATPAQIANAGAMVQGDVTVILDGTAFYPTTTNGVATSGRVFGCNNLNGTPQGTVLVHVLQTKGVTESGGTYTVNNTKPTKNTDTYEVEAVYGGGNLAAYEPWDANATGQYTGTGISPVNKPVQVVIDGCDLTSIDYVYGGGNAASVPATQVTVLGAYEIGTVFGGGNGKDALPNGDPNPGAHVGYKADGTTTYGNGTSNVYLYGGTIHSAFGGSNTKGNIRGEADVRIDEATDGSGNIICPLEIDEVYGGGNEAEMYGGSNIDLGCITSLKAIYGGAKNANVGDDIVLTITSGHFDRVFGGNNIGGTINGSITVNIEETGCHPITIGELYGCGNQAAYTAPEGKSGATVNIKSFTSIGRVFGGGLGATATVTGNTTVNINEVLGEHANTAYAGANITLDGTTVALPPHTLNKIGAIGTVFGGGNLAKVIGNPTVNVGTESTVTFVSLVDDSSTASVDERVKNVVGVDIRDNIYGGGNFAEVEGDPKVNIGKE